jgi:hypothetical protein
VTTASENARSTSQAFYLTLISITCSLALGYLLQSVQPERLIHGHFAVGYTLRVLLLFQMIVLTWHEYALGTVYFQWQINYLDSAVPFSFAIVQYLAISALAADKDWGLAASVALFAFVSVLAYGNQKKKAGRDSANTEMIAHHRTFHRTSLVTCLVVSLACGALSWSLYRGVKAGPEWVWPLIANVVFLAFPILSGRLRRSAALALRVSV